MRDFLLVAVVTTAVFGTQWAAASADPPREAPIAAAARQGESVEPLSMPDARRASAQSAQAAPQSRTADLGAAGAVNSGGSAYTPLAPVRLLDTRPNSPIQGEQTRQLSMGDRVPATATAVVLNLTGVSPTGNTFLSMYPSTAPRPSATNLNLRPGETRSNAVTVALDASRVLTIFNNVGSTHVVVDLAGYYAPGAGSRFTAQSPVRVMDTRLSGGVFGPGGTRTLDLSGRVPASATAVTLNLTGASATAATFVSVWPTGTTRSSASTLNLVPGQITPNQVTVALGANRSVSIYNNWGNTHLVADLGGYYATDRGNPFYQMTPMRVLDTRIHPGVPLQGGSYGIIGLSQELPPSASAVTFNLTGTESTATTYLTAYPGGSSLPNASNLNLVPGQDAANLVTVALGPNREVNMFNHVGYVDIIMDVAGYFAPPPTPCGSSCVRSWGDNEEAQLGVGTAGSFSDAPGRVDGLSGVTAVTAGFLNSYALRNDGTVWSWGSNGLQGLGNGELYGISTVPGRVGSLSGIRQIAAGSYTGYALDNAGKVWSWGYNSDGSLGDGSADPKAGVVAVQLPSDVSQIAAGFTTAYALRADGTVWAWGSNGGSLGNGSFGTGCESVPVGPGCRATTPVQVPNLTGVVSIAATRNATFAVKSDGSVVAWGFNAHAELGLGSAGGPSCYDTPNTPACTAVSPTTVPGLTGVAKVVSGSTSSTYALKTDGTVLSWGWNGDAQLGNGTTGGECFQPSDPNCVGLSPAPVSNLTGITDVVGGAGYAMALRSDATVWTWGYGSQGQLGHVESPVPGQVPGLTGVTAIGGGSATSLAVS